MAKKSLWYQRGFDNADRVAMLEGRETVQLMSQMVGHRYGYQLHRYPKKEEQFRKGYWDSIESQRLKAQTKVFDKNHAEG